jgi:hypothetical protein
VEDPHNFRSGASRFGAVRYLAKYLTKSSEDVELWFAEKQWERVGSGLIEISSEALSDPVKAVE